MNRVLKCRVSKKKKNRGGGVKIKKKNNYTWLS